MIISSLLASAAILAADPLAEAKIVDATIFKNGYAVTVRQVQVPASGEVLVKTPMVAVTGTLWIYGAQNSPVQSVVATKSAEETSNMVSAGSVAEALSLNKGKTMTLRWYDQSAWQDVTGKVVEVSNQLAVLEVEGGSRMFVPVSTISSFKGSSDLVWTRVEKSVVETPVLRIKAKPNSAVNLMALQPGATWYPAYALDISDPKRLKLTAKATIVNDLDDLAGVPVRLVTGFPNIGYLGQWDPLTYMFAAMRGGDAGFGGAPMPAANQQVSGRRESAANFDSFVPSAGPGFSGEDLFFLPLEKVNLKKSERGYYVLFTAESDYRHLYTLELPDSSVSGGTRDYNRGDLDIWHAIEFDNNTKMPWTTGTALILQNGQMIGEDELKYTTAGTKAKVNIAKALDISAEAREEEITRERGVLKDQYNNPRWDLVTVRGTIELTNMKGASVDMLIRKVVEGEITQAPGSSNITKSAKRLNQINVTSMMEWRPSLDKGEKKILTYTYQVYAPVN